MRYVLALLRSLCILFQFHTRQIKGMQAEIKLSEQSTTLNHYSPYATIRRLIYYWIIWNSRVVNPTLENWNTSEWVFWANKWYAEVKANNRIGL